MTRSARTWMWVVFLLGLLGLPGACSGGALIGGECRSGLSRCGNTCIDLAQDVDNCGACGMACEADQFCNRGVCRLNSSGLGGAMSAGAGGTVSSGGSSGMSPLGGAAGVGGLNLGGSGGGAGTETGGTEAGGSVSMAGSGGMSATGGVEGNAGTSGSGGAPMGGTGGGGPVCNAPSTTCAQACVDTQTDPLHCGDCFTECPSGLCTAGQCVGAASGHIVLMCTNMRLATPTSSFGILLGNAAFLPLSNLAPSRPLRILAYSKYADAPSIASTTAAIDYAAGQRGRTVSLTSVTDDALIASQLKVLNYELFLVYDQPNAPVGGMAQNGSDWSAAISNFVGSGGTVVMLSSGTSTRGDGDMDEFATNAGLLTITGETDANLQLLYNRAPTDAVGTGASKLFLPPRDTCTFTTPAPTEATTVFVVSDSAPVDGLGRPTVVHRIP